jgi:hypothetical protein
MGNACQTDTRIFSDMEGDIFTRLAKHNQTHLGDHYHALQDPQKKEAFLKQLEGIDYEQVGQLYQHVYVDRQEAKDQNKVDYQPLTDVATHEDLKVQAKEFEDIGFEAIGRGEGTHASMQWLCAS